MLLAEEMEVTLDQVALEHAPADPTRYANPFGDQIAGGSIASAPFMSGVNAGAVSRIMLVNAAARGRGVAPDRCAARPVKSFTPPAVADAPYGSLIELQRPRQFRRKCR